MKYEAVYSYSQGFTVSKVCRALELDESAYYQWLSRKIAKTEKQEKEKVLIEKVREVFEKNKRVYGYRKMQQAMIQEGIPLSEYKVRKIMKQNGMYPVTEKKFKPAKRGKVQGNYYDDSLKQNFKVEALNKVWVGDITYIKTILGWIYLAIVMDLFNREIIGYAINITADSELVKRALANALINTGGGGPDTIFHSDRGIQYSSKSFQDMLLKHGIKGSMSRPGCPYDNACAESFMSTAKRECISRKEYATIEQVKQDLYQYIVIFYNRKRMHRSLGYMSPVEYRLTKIV